MAWPRPTGGLVALLWATALCLVVGAALPIGKVGFLPRHTVGIVLASASTLVAVAKTVLWAASRAVERKTDSKREGGKPGRGT